MCEYCGRGFLEVQGEGGLMVTAMNKVLVLKLGAVHRGVVLAGLLFPLGTPAHSKDFEFTVLDLPYSHSEMGTQVWRSEAGWLSAWSKDRIGFCGHSLPPPAPPTVDFKKYEVVGIFLGRGNEATPIPKIKRIYDAGNEVVVQYIVGNKARASVRAVRGVVVCRKIVARIPKSGKPVRFQAVPGILP